MFQNRRSFMAVLAIASALFATTFASTEVLAGGGGGKDPKIEGRLISITGRSVSIKLQNGTTTGIVVPTTAKIERNGAKTTLASFKAGDLVQARFASDGKTVIKFEGAGL